MWITATCDGRHWPQSMGAANFSSMLLKRSLIFGLALLLGNWIPSAAFLSHHCMGPVQVIETEAGAESTGDGAAAHPAEGELACCPRHTHQGAAFEANEAQRMSCIAKPRDCCALHGRTSSVPLPQVKASAASRVVVAATVERGVPAGQAHGIVISTMRYPQVSPIQTTCLRI